MGINRVIDFGSVENPAGRVPLAEGTYLGETVSFKFKEANTGNVGIETVYQIVDPDAVDVEGNEFKGKLTDVMWFSDKSLKVTKMKLRELGVDVDTLVISNTEDLKDFIGDLKDNHTGLEVNLVTQIEESEWQGKTRTKARIAFINAVE